MSDMLLNGRPAGDLERDLALLAGLLAEYPRAEVPVSRPVSDLPVLP